MNTKTYPTDHEEELDACLAAYNAYLEAMGHGPEYVWCCHHGIRVERLTENYSVRLNYIGSSKPADQWAVRFRNFRPVRVELPENVKEAAVRYADANAAVETSFDAYQKAAGALDLCRIELGDLNPGHGQAALRAEMVTLQFARGRAHRAYQSSVSKHSEAVWVLCNASEGLRALHDADWPDNTWCARDIFGGNDEAHGIWIDPNAVASEQVVP